MLGIVNVVMLLHMCWYELPLLYLTLYYCIMNLYQLQFALKWNNYNIKQYHVYY